MSLLPTTRSINDQYPRLDGIVVGAGFAGLYMLHRLRTLGLRAQIFEAEHGVGGTWLRNCYPGARCDVESLQYSYSFSEELERDWKWSERYASQTEILRYLNYVADRFDLRRDIRFGTTVVAASFDETADQWTIETNQADRVSARFCVMATGCLSSARIPAIQGIDSFRGTTYHTGAWPHEAVDFAGKRVGVIGTGSSATQLIPIVAKQASHLVVFQRTPNFSIPAHNRLLAPEELEDWQRNRAEYRRTARRVPFGILIESPTKSAMEVSEEERHRAYEARWRRGGLGLGGAFKDIYLNRQANDTLVAFVRTKIQGIIRDPDVAKKLVATDYPYGTKRPCVDTGYYETFNRSNVTLVDIRATPVREITCSGLRTSDAEYALDSIVFATGFDAITGALNRIDIRGRGGLPLREKWSQGPLTYLGLMVAGFPNLFIITGPGSPSVLSNVVVSIEQHVEWISDCITHLGEHSLATIEPTVDAEKRWVEHVNEVANHTLFPLTNSWYVGANIPGKPRVFMPYVGGVGVYRDKCEAVTAGGYQGFLFKTARNEARKRAALNGSANT